MALPSAAVVPAKRNWHEERMLQDVPRPIADPLDHAAMWGADGLPNLEALKYHFLHEGLLNMDDALLLVQKAAAILRKEPNLLHLTDPITVCGDIHGQYFDLIKLFEIGGDPRSTQYLFLGDYVDRGCFSCECALYLLAHKIHFPNTFLMLRGNHECRHLTAYFNFKQECRHKYSLQLYDALMACFDCLPLAAILNGRFLCVHGGLSPDVQTVDDIAAINRFREPPPCGAMTDLIWSDPMDEEEEEGSPDALYLHNDLRGCSYVFSFNAVCQFLTANNLLSVIRAHEAQDEGYRLYKKNPRTGFPTVICIFSAPNYCDAYNNKAAIIKFNNNLMNIRQFNSSPHPYFLPNFMNAFAWSLPFVCEKVTDVLLTIWHLVDDGEDDDLDLPPGTPKSNDKVRSKILQMGKVARMYKNLKEEDIAALRSAGKLPANVNFDAVRKMDAQNERRPINGGAAGGEVAVKKPRD